MNESGFANAGLTTVLLPSGYRGRGVVPGLGILAERGLLDIRVRQAALRLAKPEWLAEPEAAQERDLRAYVDALVAGFPREAQDPGPGGDWKPVVLGIPDLDRIDQRDRGLLESLVMHVLTADEVTARAEAALAIRDPEEVPSELDRLAEFRDGSGGPAGGQDGASLGEPALDPDGDGG